MFHTIFHSLKKAIANAIFAALLLPASLQVIAGSDMVTASEDAPIHLFQGNDGNGSLLMIVGMGINGNSTYPVLRFDTNPVAEVTAAQLLLDLSDYWIYSGPTPASATFRVWGVPDLDDIEEEDDLSSEFAYLVGDPVYGVKPSYAHGGAPLAEFTATQADEGTTLSVFSAALTDYIEAKAGGSMALVITRVETTTNFYTGFATREHGSLRPPRLFVTVPDEYFTPSDDSYGRLGSSEINGNAGVLLVKNSDGGSSTTTRKAVIEFTVPTGMVAEDAALQLDVSGYNYSSGFYPAAGFYVWGIKDGKPQEDFNEDIFQYGNFPLLFDSSADGVYNNGPYIHDGNPNLQSAQELGIMAVNQWQVGETVEFRSDALIDFINSNTNDKITFVLTRLTDGGALNNSFASKENPNLNPPTLYVRPQVERRMPGTVTQFVYYDVDQDNDMDLILTVDPPEGGGFLVAEPFVIADYLEQVGMGLGSGDQFYNLLSSSQQQSLHDTMYTLANNDCVQQAANHAITATEIQDALANLPGKREYPISSFTSMATLEADLASGAFDVAVHYPGCEIYGYSHGELSVTISGPSADAGMTVSENGIAMGATYSFYTASATYGNENGTYVGVSASAGAGYWVAASWGQSGQYGATFPIPGTPVCLSIYVAGSDAEAVYASASSALAGTAQQAAQWYEEDWDAEINWNGDTTAAVDNVISEYRLYIKRSGNYAKVWVDHLGEQAMVEYQGNSGDVTEALDDTVDNTTVASDNAADDLVDAADRAGSTSKSVWSKTAGWIQGSANSVWNGIGNWF